MKIKIVLLFISIPILIQAQNERWDNNSCTYSNFEYGFSWKLPASDSWEKESGIEKHTIFRASNKNVVVFVNARILDNPHVNDLWVYYDKLTETILKTSKLIEQYNGEKISNYSFKKSIFCGKNAFKSYYVSTMLDDRYKKPLRVVALCYGYLYDGVFYQVTIKSEKTFYDRNSESINNIFKGFNIIVKSQS